VDNYHIKFFMLALTLWGLKNIMNIFFLDRVFNPFFIKRKDNQVLQGRYIGLASNLWITNEIP
jgi:hypothetical protein